MVLQPGAARQKTSEVKAIQNLEAGSTKLSCRSMVQRGESNAVLRSLWMSQETLGGGHDPRHCGMPHNTCFSYPQLSHHLSAAWLLVWAKRTHLPLGYKVVSLRWRV